jgi:hypothetical protein
LFLVPGDFMTFTLLRHALSDARIFLKRANGRRIANQVGLPLARASTKEYASNSNPIPLGQLLEGTGIGR